MATDSVELLALQRIDETSMQLQRQGNYLQALECMERGLVLRQHFFGSDSDEVWSACKIVGEMCNLLAMTYLQQEDFEMVLELLKKAEILTERDDVGRAVTYNNLACYYRRRGKLHAALQYLHKALRIEAKMGSRVEYPADTHLNTCAVLSQIGRHQGALEHAQSALILLQEELFGANNRVACAGHEQPPRADRIAVLAIAYHNMGVEQEFLRKFEHSLQSYRKGVEVAQKFLGDNHAVTVTLRNSTMAARRAISARDSKIREELTRRKHRRPQGLEHGGPGRAKSPMRPGLLKSALASSDQPEPEASRNDPQEQQEQQEPGQDNKRAEQMARELLESTSVGPSPPPTQARETSQTEERTDINHDPSLACMITPRPRDGSPPEEDDEEASTRPGEEPGEKPGEGTRGKGIMLRRESETEYLHESSREEGEDEASLGLPLGPSGDERWCGQPQGEPNPESTGRSIPEELHEQESRKPPVEEPEDDEARDPPRDVALEANEAHEETLDEHGTHADDQSLLK